jgi:uncharacterized YigZ family protein
VRVPAASSQAEVREKGSRFLAVVQAAASEAEGKAAVAALARRHHDATHWCWAWRIGWPPRERSADAGEPAGTAGMPILQVLRGADLNDVCAVVVRWFGGTKLGKGGLARAYAAATRAAVDALPVALRIPTVTVACELPYDRLGAAKRLVHPPEVELLSETYGSAVRLVLRAHEERAPTLLAALAELGAKRVEGGVGGV